MNQFDGTLIAGRYEIREHIATGGMASVFKTWDHRVERIVAIKVAAAKFSERFEREARAVAALNHPHICSQKQLEYKLATFGSFSGRDVYFVGHSLGSVICLDQGGITPTAKENSER